MLTAKDIADLSGVSRTTVFAVLGGKPGVTEKTREKVLEVLREHGYQNGLVQRSMVAELSKIIGAVIGNINNPFYTELITGIDKVLAPEGFHHLLHYGTDLDPREGIAAFDALGEYNLRGYIMAAGEMARYENHIRRVVAFNRPLVTIMRAPGVQTSAVWFDDRKCSRDTTDYLISRGHRRIVCLTGPSQSAVAKERILGFMESLVAKDIEFDSSMIVRGGDTSDDGYHAALKVLADPVNRPTAVECCNDLVAIGVYRAAHELGLKIPEDISVVGFDGIELGEVLGPPLTTLSVFPRRMGEIAAEMLLAIINGKHRRGHQEHVMEHALIERASVRSV